MTDIVRQLIWDKKQVLSPIDWRCDLVVPDSVAADLVNYYRCKVATDIRYVVTSTAAPGRLERSPDAIECFGCGVRWAVDDQGVFYMGPVTFPCTRCGSLEFVCVSQP